MSSELNGMVVRHKSNVGGPRRILLREMFEFLGRI